MEGLTEKNGGFDRETDQECLWPVYDSFTLQGRGKKFTIKYFCEMGVHAK